MPLKPLKNLINPHKRGAGTVAELSIAIVLLLLLGFAGKERAVRPFDEGEALLLADFEGNTEDPAVAEEIKQLLRITLDQSPYFSLYPEAKVRDALRLMFLDPAAAMNSAVAMQLCVREGLAGYLAPRIYRMGTGSLVSLGVVQVAADGIHALPIATVAVKNDAELLVAMEALGKRAREALGESRSSPSMSGTIFAENAISTPDAVRSFAEALGFRSDRKAESGAQLLEKAVEANPRFALAQARLAHLLERRGKTEAALNHIARARDCAAQLPPKEMHRVLGSFYAMREEYPAAMKQFEAMVDLDPDDWTAHYHLARAALHAGDLSRSITEFNAALARNDLQVDSYLGLCRAHMENQDNALARQACGQAIVWEPDDPEVIWADANLDLVDNNLRQALGKFLKVVQHSSDQVRSRGIYLLGQAEVYAGKFQEAIATLDAGIADDRMHQDMEAEVDKRIVKASAYILSGRRDDAASSCLEALRLAQNGRQLARLGTICAKTGRLDEARNIAARMEGIALHAGDLEVVRGEIALASNQPEEAVRHFRRAKAKRPVILPSEPLARALAAAGRLEEAAQEYRLVCRYKAAMLFRADATAGMGNWVQALYDAGFLMQRIGKNAEARQLLRNYLWVLDGADPDLPSVQQVRAFLRPRAR